MCWERFSEASQRFICSRFHCCCSFFPRRPRRGTRFRPFSFFIDSAGATLWRRRGHSCYPDGPVVSCGHAKHAGDLIGSLTISRGGLEIQFQRHGRLKRRGVAEDRDPRLYCSRGPDENILVGEGWTRGLGMGPALLFVAATSEDGGGVQRPEWLECYIHVYVMYEYTPCC